jgi:hypothetical protein
VSPDRNGHGINPRSVPELSPLSAGGEEEGATFRSETIGDGGQSGTIGDGGEGEAGGLTHAPWTDPEVKASRRGLGEAPVDDLGSWPTGDEGSPPYGGIGRRRAVRAGTLDYSYEESLTAEGTVVSLT